MPRCITVAAVAAMVLCLADRSTAGPSAAEEAKWAAAEEERLTFRRVVRQHEKMHPGQAVRAVERISRRLRDKFASMAPDDPARLGYERRKARVSETAAMLACGDGVLQPVHGETCDDGNSRNFDGCNHYCRSESAHICPSGGGACTKPAEDDFFVQVESGGTLVSADNIAFPLGIGGGQVASADCDETFSDMEHKTVGINDGCYGNECSWIGKQCTYTFASPQTVQSMAFGRDNNGRYTDRGQGERTIEYREDHRDWKVAGTIMKVGTNRRLYNARAPLFNVIQLRIINPSNRICIDEWEVYNKTF